MAKKRKIAPRAPKRVNLFPEQDFFQKIEYPNDFRRNLLEASKATLSALKGVYAVKDARQKKIQKLAEVQRAIREVRLLIQKAEEIMPKYSKQQAIKKFPHLAPKKEPPKKIEPPKPVPKLIVKKEPVRKEPPVIQRSKSELDRLTESISSIENKIKQLPNEPAPPRKKKEEQKPNQKQDNSPTTKEEGVPKSVVAGQKADDLGLELGRALDKIHKKLKDM